MADGNRGIHLARHLASNDKKTRQKAVKRIGMYLELRSQSKENRFSKDDFAKLWKGLFYCMWMSDKPILQEELGSALSCLVHRIRDMDQQLSFVGEFFVCMEREWVGIDYLRIDKFTMWVRQFMREYFEILRRVGWTEEYVDALVNLLFTDGPLRNTMYGCPDGLRFQICEVYLDELSKSGGRNLSRGTVNQFISPFISLLAVSKSKTFQSAIIKKVFNRIIEYKTKLLFDTLDRSLKSSYGKIGGIAKVNHTYQQLEFDLKSITDLVLEEAKKPSVKSSNRSRLYALLLRIQTVNKKVKKTEVKNNDSITCGDVSSEQSETGKLVGSSNGEVKTKKKRKIIVKDEGLIHSNESHPDPPKKKKKNKKINENISVQTEIPTALSNSSRPESVGRKSDVVIPDDATPMAPIHSPLPVDDLPFAMSDSLPVLQRVEVSGGGDFTRITNGQVKGKPKGNRRSGIAASKIDSSENPVQSVSEVSIETTSSIEESSKRIKPTKDANLVLTTPATPRDRKPDTTDPTNSSQPLRDSVPRHVLFSDKALLRTKSKLSRTPYDGSKLPGKGVLKNSAEKSPVNLKRVRVPKGKVLYN